MVKPVEVRGESTTRFFYKVSGPGALGVYLIHDEKGVVFVDKLLTTCGQVT